MASLKDFLAKKALQPNQIQRRQRRDEWIAAVKRLNSQLQDWIGQADPQGVLDVEIFPYDRHEESIGHYVVDGIEIRSDNAVIEVVPVGCGVLRPDLGLDDETHVEGRVDISNGAEKVILYRTVKGSEEQWTIGTGAPAATVLDQAQFERIIQELLS